LPHSHKKHVYFISVGTSDELARPPSWDISGFAPQS
jgi:hypothetical protein